MLLLLTLFWCIDLVPNLGVNYQNCVMGPFDGLFFSISVLTRTYFIEHKWSWEKQAKSIVVRA